MSFWFTEFFKSLIILFGFPTLKYSIMNITSQSMKAVIMNNVGELDSDPHLKKLFTELNALAEELNGDNKISKKLITNNISNSEYKIPAIQTLKKKRRRTDGDIAFRSSCVITPELRRKSDRLIGKIPQYDKMNDIAELQNSKRFSNVALRQKIDVTKRSRQFFHHSNITRRIILSPEEITKEMLENIAYKLNDRIYDPINGTSCHQCRQKTGDTKTICRNIECIGVRGQFCGPCAKNRYGCDVKEALLDPSWICFVCQGVCNCSFCRSRKGKMPTGILTPTAKREGHSSVKDFLDALILAGVEKPDNTEYQDDPEALHGFLDHDTAMTLNGSEELISGCIGGREIHLFQESIQEEDFRTHFCGFLEDSIIEAKRKEQITKNVLENILPASL